MINNFDAQDIEQAIIGAILLGDEDALITAAGLIAAEDFTTSEYRDAFEAACALSDEGANIDHLTVMALLEKNGKAADKAVWLAAMEAVGSVAALPDYCAGLREKAARNRLNELALRVHEDIATGRDVDEITEDVLNALEAAKEKGAKANDVFYNSDLIALARSLAEGGQVRVPTGFAPLDRILGGGFVEGGLYILAGRPGKGKTTVALSVAQNVATRGKTVMYVNMEMTAEQIAARRVAREAVVTYTKVLNGEMNDEERRRVTEAISRLKTSRFRSISGRATTAQISAQIRRMKDKPEFVVIDYIGLLSRQAGDTRSRYDVISDFSRELKQMALKFGVPVLCLAQLNREAAKGAPEVFHLRDSGNLEQDADGVILLSETETEGTNKLGEFKGISFNVAKHRHGKCGDVFMKMFPATGIIE
ncbi:MAG: AAA family ATPase [Clostridia bacterium]|nr:AAA family ATPase [Clostridia bacterium]